MAVDDRWKENPIDWTLNDFVKGKLLPKLHPEAEMGSDCFE